MDTSLPLNQSCHLALERCCRLEKRGLRWRYKEVRTIRFHKFFYTLCRWLQTYVMVAII